jgi:hypothetical protein
MGIYFIKHNLNEDTKNHYSFSGFENGFRINAIVGTYSFTGIRKKVLENLYEKYWNKIIVECKMETINNIIIEFNQDEFFRIKQTIILDHMYIYALNINKKIKIIDEDLNHPMTWDTIKEYSIKKYKDNTLFSDTLAANTIGININEYIEWRKNRELWENR